ncbi:MAG: hypothetical protein J0H01_22600 [Rhizobiales bacterium]|nr:hypothetical protein [Hyphomicrobiales bacterium]
MHLAAPHPIAITAKLCSCRNARRRSSAELAAFAPGWFVLPFALAFGFLILAARPLPAHDIYMDLKNRAGRSCCNGADCRPVPYRQTSSGVQMFIEGVWVTIPDAQVEQRSIEGDTGETGGGHWCGRRLNGENRFMTYCAFVPPSATQITPPRPPGGLSRLLRARLARAEASAR